MSEKPIAPTALTTARSATRPDRPRDPSGRFSCRLGIIDPVAQLKRRPMAVKSKTEVVQTEPASVSKASRSTKPRGSRNKLISRAIVCTVVLRPRHSERPSGRLVHPFGATTSQSKLGLASSRRANNAYILPERCQQNASMTVRSSSGGSPPWSGTDIHPATVSRRISPGRPTSAKLASTAISKSGSVSGSIVVGLTLGGERGFSWPSPLVGRHQYEGQKSGQTYVVDLPP
jgi:hypothetical protein